MLLAIGLQESRLTHRRQIGGPARGLWQFERGGGVAGVLRHAASRDHALSVCDARRVAPGVLRDARRLGLPVVAIGGITPDNARSVVEAGADLLAVISGVFDAHDPAAAARRYLHAFDADAP